MRQSSYRQFQATAAHFPYKWDIYQTTKFGENELSSFEDPLFNRQGWVKVGKVIDSRLLGLDLPFGGSLLNILGSFRVRFTSAIAHTNLCIL